MPGRGFQALFQVNPGQFYFIWFDLLVVIITYFFNYIIKLTKLIKLNTINDPTLKFLPIL